MIVAEDIKKMLAVAVNAPSGSNSQPWKFRVKGNELEIIALPERDHPVLNFRNRGTWVAHGALIENIIIASGASGYRTEVNVFPDKNNSNLTARIRFTKTTAVKDSLSDAIPRRTTNRKPYQPIPLTPDQRKELLSAAGGKGCEVRFIEDQRVFSKIGEAMSMNEVIMLENRELHKLFFDEIVWTEGEERKKKSGLYLQTMELKPPQQKALKLLKHWPVMNLLNKVGMAWMVARDNAKTYASASAIGIIIVEDNDADFVTAGRVMERLWLRATNMGLGFHLITGVLFLWQRIMAGDTAPLSEKHVALVKSAYRALTDVYGVNQGVIAMLFRIGNGGQPSARSTKAPPEIRWA